MGSMRIDYLREVFQSELHTHQIWSFTDCNIFRISACWNCPVSQSFSPSLEQPEQHNAHKSEQPTASCIATFHKYPCFINHWGIAINLKIYEILWCMLLIYQNATMRVCGAWIRICYSLCSKIIYHLWRSVLVIHNICNPCEIKRDGIWWNWKW